jgi:hypothetical protein
MAWTLGYNLKISSQTQNEFSQPLHLHTLQRLSFLQLLERVQ